MTYVGDAILDEPATTPHCRAVRGGPVFIMVLLAKLRPSDPIGTRAVP